MIILGIETSCDDTGIALVKKTAKGFSVLSNVVSSQIKTHAPYGGVVPNLAAREHLKNIKPCLDRALTKYNPAKIDLIAVTRGPGLIPSLLVGVNFAKALSYRWQKPLIGINHIEGHIYANWLSSTNQVPDKKIFPALCLIVSGGHTQLILMKNHSQYQLLGQTRDDAAGEAFDKVAKLIKLGYPGGPLISQYARAGDPAKFNLPRPMINSKTGKYDFSFSGLKTAVLYLIREQKIKLTQTNISHLAASFQQAAIDVLVAKTIKAGQSHQVKTIILSGGVAANQELRQQLKKAIQAKLPQTTYHLPKLEHCGDNAAMICAAAGFKKKPTSLKSWAKIQAEANLKLVA